MNNLPFSVLREANTKRLPLFKNKQGEKCHSHNGSDWTLLQWWQAIIGEVGEYANTRKKFQRGDIREDEYRSLAGEELADIFTYIDLTAFRCGLELSSILPVSDFNSLTDLCRFRDQTKPEYWLIMLVKSLAKLSDKLYDMEMAESEIFPKHKLSKHFEFSLVHLSILARCQGIDLGAEVVSKFNEVSRRIGCDVMIYESNDGSYFETDDIPF